LSAHAAAIEAGFRSKQLTVYPDDPHRTAAVLRRHLTTTARRQRVIADMRADGMTTTDIAAAVGVSDETVRTSLNSVSKFLETGLPATVTGKDGKLYPTRKRRKPRARGLYELRGTCPAKLSRRSLAPVGCTLP
jgi:hypothetical protein